MHSRHGVKRKSDYEDNIAREEKRAKYARGDEYFWGPYLSDRQWATVREDNSRDCDCWNSVDFESSVSYSYKRGEDGLFGWCDKECRLCTSIGLWNGKDEMLKERLFGLSGPQGNHGEDVKELYYYLNGIHTHNYNEALYKYPQSKFPYQELVQENRVRGLKEKEFKLFDTGIFDKGYWDINMKYVKDTPNMTYCYCTVKNMGQNVDMLYILPHLWFRNTWHDGCEKKPCLTKIDDNKVEAVYKFGTYVVTFWYTNNTSQLIFTENESKSSSSDKTRYYKNAFHEYLIKGDKNAINPACNGTKCTAVYKVSLKPNEETCIIWTIVPSEHPDSLSLAHIQNVCDMRKIEMENFYKQIIPNNWSPAEVNVALQAYGGLLWSKQYYNYNVNKHHKEITQKHKDSEGLMLWNKRWKNMKCHDILSVPDKWEFPWFATWDTAFQMIVYSKVDFQFAENQMLLFLSDRYMKLDGQVYNLKMF